MSFMVVYRIAKKKSRANDLSGIGAYNEGGRWNNEGTYALYTSESRALAALEVLVHLDQSELPCNLYIMSIEIDDSAPLYKLPDSKLPANWRTPGNFELKTMGDRIFSENKYLGIKVRSAVMPNEYNYVLNPLFPNYGKLLRIIGTEEYNIDPRLSK